MQTKDLRLKRALWAALMLLLLGAAGMANAQTFTVGNLNYSVNEGTQTVTLTGHVDGTNATGELIIPDSVLYAGNYYAVTTIGNNAFYQCNGFSGSLSVPNSVTTIGNNAFYQCNGFTGSLTIGNSVTTIERTAFDGCSGFTGNLTIPNSVTTIGEDAFYNCSGFTGSLTIPNSVTTIGYCAFEYCYGFTGSLTIGNSVTTIGNGAFKYCNGFTGSLTIGNAVTTIGNSAFDNCTGFTGSLTIPNSVTTIGDRAFWQCYGFKGSLTIGNAVTTIGNSAFEDCGFTGSLTIPNSVTTIGDRAFFYCYSFTGSLTIPNSVTSIGSTAFRGCSGFAGSLTIGNSVTTIGEFAFCEITGFTSIESLAFAPPAIGNFAFYGWDTTTPVNVPCGSSPAYSGWGGFSNIIDPCTFYVKEVMLLGGSSSEVNALLPVYQADGWHRINNDLNAGCGSGSDYIYLLYKSEASENVNLGYVTYFYISNAGGTAPDSLTYDDRVYHLVPYDGGSHFKNTKGDLNSNAGGADIHLYFTKDYFPDNQTVTGITFNATQSEALGVNGGTEGYDLNKGASGDYIYMHVATEEALRPIQVTAVANPTEGGTVSGAGIYGLGTTCTLTATVNEGYTFINWMQDGEVVSTEATYSFTVTEASAFVANFEATSTDLAQSTNFVSGWNWWSSYIDLDGIDGLAMLQSGLGTSGMMIKSQNDGYESYLNGYGWYGLLTSLNNQSTYKVKTNGACTVEMTGSATNPADYPVTLDPGWTWVGYPVSTSMSVAEALAGITPQNGDMLKSQNDSFASYLDGFGWYGSLSILNPGMGLMYKSNNSSAVTFVYPNGGTRTDLKANQTAENNHWQPNLNAYPDNMSVMAVVELDGNELQGENYELAAFANGEVRGSARLLYVEPLNRYMAFLTVAGDEAAELDFGLYNTKTGAVETQCLASLQYETNAVVGSFSEPYIVSFRGNMGVDEQGSGLRLYPNPAKSVICIEGLAANSEVRIFNSLGELVKVVTASADCEIGIGDLASGIYLIRCCNTSLRFVKD